MTAKIPENCGVGAPYRRWLALLLEIPVGLALIVFCTLEVVARSTSEGPIAFKFRPQATCAPPEITSDSTENQIHRQVISLNIIVDENGAGLYTPLYYPLRRYGGEKNDKTNICSNFVVESSLSIADASLEGPKENIPVSPNEILDFPVPGPANIYLFDKTDPKFHTFGLHLKNVANQTSQGRFTLAIDIKGYGSNPGRKEGVLKEAYNRLNTQLKEIQIFTFSDWELLQSVPTKSDFSLTWEVKATSKQKKTESETGKAQPSYKYTIDLSEHRSVLLTFFNKEKAKRDQIAIIIFSTLLGIGVGLLVDSMKFIIRG